MVFERDQSNNNPMTILKYHWSLMLTYAILTKKHGGTISINATIYLILFGFVK